jgi:hypothetical protein
MSGINGPSTTYLLRSSGRPRLVVDSGTGNIVERIDYDEFGNIIADLHRGSRKIAETGNSPSA